MILGRVWKVKVCGTGIKREMLERRWLWWPVGRRFLVESFQICYAVRIATANSDTPRARGGSGQNTEHPSHYNAHGTGTTTETRTHGRDTPPFTYISPHTHTHTHTHTVKYCSFPRLKQSGCELKGFSTKPILKNADILNASTLPDANSRLGKVHSQHSAATSLRLTSWRSIETGNIQRCLR